MLRISRSIMKALLRSLAAFGSFFVSACSGGTPKPPSLPYPAPAVTAVDQDGRPVDFSALYRQGITVVYFYPRADTPGCTAQSCSLRDAYAELTAAGVTVVGVSTDKPEANRRFKEKHRLPFTLVSDTEGEVMKAFGVKKIPVLGFATRQCFLIQSGQVIWHDDSASTDQQAADIKKVLAGLQNRKP